MGSESAVRPRQRAQHLGPQRRRPQVLDTALTLAVSEGLSAVTMASIADRMRVTRPVVYACFADRVQLIDALRRREENYLIHDLLATLPGRDLGEDETAVVTSFRTLLQLTAARPESWRFLAETPDPVISEEFGRGRRLAVNRCTALLRGSMLGWGTTAADRKLPVLVDQWLAAGEGAVQTLMAGTADWAPEDLGDFVGGQVFRMLRDA
ncbi:TetR/AcrR family transcriptional regulator [Nocardia sp. NPDC057227]|uniref:TetR/AcrR family transcriptional regulator n=1 Tax=Nocardia sp. NPDC057227 TaxID=3346056 RepID=UPI00363A10A7